MNGVSVGFSFDLGWSGAAAVEYLTRGLQIALLGLVLAVGSPSAASAAKGGKPAKLPDVIVTSLSYSSATGIFTSVVRNQGTAATPAGLSIGVAYFVDGTYRTSGSVTGPLSAGTSVTIGSNGGAYVIPSGTHTILAYVDDANRFGESNETNNQLSQTIVVDASDTTAPSAPTALTATAVSATQINLLWTAATDNMGVTGYRVYRGGALIATLGAVTIFQNTSLTASTTYSYTVQALDAAGNASAQSIAASAATQAAADTTAPSTPMGLSATAVSSSRIDLSWATATDNVGVTGYNVYRGGALIATLGVATSFQNTGLTASTTYTYAVRALDAAGNISAPSSSASATTQAAADITAPSTPVGLSATAASSAQINLSWAAATDNVGVTGYNVFRGGMQISTLGSVTSYQNTGLTATTTYTYNVQAFDAAGNVSGQSIAASATTQAPGNTATLTWDVAAGTSLIGYRVYYGTAPGTYFQAFGSGVNAGNVTTFTVTGLTSGTTYYFVARAYDASNREGYNSNEIFKVIP